MKARKAKHRISVTALAALVALGLCLGVVGAGLGPAGLAGLAQPSEAHAAENPQPAWMPRALVIDCFGAWRDYDDDATAAKLSELGFIVDRYENYAAPDYREVIPCPHWALAELFRHNTYNVVVYYGHGGDDYKYNLGWGFDPGDNFPDSKDYRYPLEQDHIGQGRRIWGDFTRGYVPWTDRNGTEYPFRLAKGAMVILYSACYSAGLSSSDPATPVLSDAEILRRVNEYSYTFLHREFPGADTYVAGPGSIPGFLDTLWRNPTTPIGQLAVPDYSASGATLLEGAHYYMGGEGMRYRKNKWPGTTNSAVWGGGAWAGDPRATFSSVHSGTIPTPGDDDTPSYGEPGWQPDPRDANDGGDNSFNFFPFLSVTNPTGTDTVAEVIFYDENGEYLRVYRGVPANARITLDLNANPYLRDKNLAVKVKSLNAAVPLLAERPMYFRYQGWMDGGSDAFGATGAHTSWYFAEGYTADNFDEYICLANFGAYAVKGTLTLYREGLAPAQVAISVPAGTRQTHLIDNYVQGNVSVKVETNAPIVAERSMYFNYGSRGGFHCDGGHTKRGITELGTSWYLAEGYVSNGFEEWVALVNPNTQKATATVTYYTEAGKHSSRAYELAPNSRFTVFVNDAFGAPTNVSVGVESTQPIAVERSMYFSYNGWADDGHVSPGVTTPANKWYFAEGSTFTGLEEYVLLVNPGSKPATVTATYLLGAGQGTHTGTYTVGANSRSTVYVNAEMAALGYPSEVGLKLSSNQPIVAERAMYFDMGRAYGGLEPIRGGHVSLGATQPATVWSFAEAYTGR